MFQELETVVLAHDVAEFGLREGDLGAVVHRASAGQAYEVEFVTGEGRTIAVLTLAADEIRAISPGEILHVRDLASV
jgi:hypothetical protein